MTQPLADRLALVTGASRGIGAVTALALARAGAHVVLVGRTEGGLAQAEEQIHAAGGSATIVPMDIAQGEHVDQLAAHVAERWGRLDILVMNAAVLGPLSPLSHVPPKDWDQVIATNLTASYRLIRDFDALLRASTAGRVVALTSSVATRPRAYWAPYAASKAGLETMLDCYADEVARVTRVRVAIVNPGATRTAMRKDAFPGEDPATLKSPAVVAEAIVGLLVQDFETGHRLDLGRTA